METVDLKKLYLYTSSPEVVWGKSAIQLNASSKKQKQNQEIVCLPTKNPN
jgi:hypothetical protein